MKKESKSHNANYIKRQAKSIKKEKGITHLQALDQSAIACGFNNWKHFLNENPKQKPLENINPYRKLLVAGINLLLEKDLISLDGENTKYSEEGNIQSSLLGHNSLIRWRDIGFQELEISVWWKYNHQLHPQANLQGNAKESFSLTTPLAKRQHYKKFVGIVASGWFERKNGKYIQGEGKRAIFDIYTRKGEKKALETTLVYQPEHFKIEGEFRF